MSILQRSRRLLPSFVAVALILAAPTAFAQTSTTKTAPMSMGVGAAKLPNNQKFTSAAAAQASCPADKIVWSSFTSTKSFHMPTSKYYGKTKHGAYLCEKTALAAGFHQAKT
jgi:hypothetical protein